MASQHYGITQFKLADLQHHIIERPIPNASEGAIEYHHAFQASYGGDSRPLCPNTARPNTLDPPDRVIIPDCFLLEWDSCKPPTEPSAEVFAKKINTTATKSRATREKATGKKATVNDRERHSAKLVVGRESKTQGKRRKMNAKKKPDGKKKTDGEKGTGQDAGDSTALDSQHRGCSDDMRLLAQEALGSSEATGAPTALQADPASQGPYHYSSLGDGALPGARHTMLAVPPQGWPDYPDQEDIAAASTAAPTQTAALIPAAAQGSHQHPHLYAETRPTAAAWEHTSAPAVPAQGWNHYPRSNEKTAPSASAYRPADVRAVAARGWQYSPYPLEAQAAGATVPVHTPALPVAVQGPHYSPFPYQETGPAAATWQQAAALASSQQGSYRRSRTDQGERSSGAAWAPTAGLVVPAQGRYSYPSSDEEAGPARTHTSTTPELEQDRESSSDDGLLTPPPPPTMGGLFEPWWAVNDDLLDIARILAHQE